MHREYRPEDMRQFDADPFAVSGGGDGEDDARGLLGFTALLGLLLGADLLVHYLGPAEWRPRSSYLTLAAAALGAIHIVYGALKALVQGRIGADFALAQACIAALVLGQPFVAAEVVFIALVGEVLEAVTFARTRRALGRLVEQTPRTARVRRDGEEIEVAARDVAVGDLVIIGPGERIPVDGPIETGRSTVDQSALTGESIPVDRGPSESVFTGTLNQFGRIEVRAEKVGSQSTFGQVVKLVRQARGRKANLERVADRLARYFLPAVEIAAGLTLLIGYLRGWPDVWSRTVAVLVVACPCALVLATPAAMLAAMAWLARRGILIKGGYALERLAACDTFAFDKTGTLTLGKPRLATLTIVPGRDEADVLRLAAAAERASRHPLAAAVDAEAVARGLVVPEVIEAHVLPGAGVEASVATGTHVTKVLVGNARLMAEHGIELDESALASRSALEDQGETPLAVAIDGAIAGWIGLRDEVREDAHDVVHDLKHLKIGQLTLLTGDREPVARRVAKQVHLKNVLAGLLPAEKAGWIKEQQEAGRRVAMVGDGINDAPALAQADAGIALGGVGADLAAEAGDLILLGDPLRHLPELVELSRATVRVIRQNIIGFAFGLNATAVTLAALGILGPVAAAVLHQIGSLLVLLNAMRLLVFGGWSELPPAQWLRSLGERIGRLDQALDLAAAWRWVVARRTGLARLAAGGLAILYAASGTVAIGPGEVGLVQRFGGYRGLLGPGLHVRPPRPFETVVRVRPDLVRGLPIGFRGRRPPTGEALRWESDHGRPSRGEEDEGPGLLVTGDGQYLEIMATLQYGIDASRPDAARRYALGVDDPAAALASMAEAAIREEVARGKMLDLLTAGRREAEAASTARLRKRLEGLDLGVLVHSIIFQDVHPPLAVVDAYRDVSRAQSEVGRRVNEAAAYRAEKLADAEAQAAARVAGAETDRNNRLGRTSSEADAFMYRAAARRLAPGLTDFRLFWERLGIVLAGKPKLILEADPHRPQRLIVPAFPAGLAGAMGVGEDSKSPAPAADAAPPNIPPTGDTTR